MCRKWTMGIFLFSIMNIPLSLTLAGPTTDRYNKDFIGQENQSREYLDNQECRSLVCEQVHEQAKGLAKLALLDEFVSQTIFLLKDLMQNIDGELEKSADSLLRYIHPHCEPTREILREVIQKQKTKPKPAGKPNHLSQGVEPLVPPVLPEQTGQTHNGDDVDYGDQYDDQKRDDFSQQSQSSFGVFDQENNEGAKGQGQQTTFTSEKKTGASQTVHTPQKASRADKFGRGWNKEDKHHQGPTKTHEDGKPVVWQDQGPAKAHDFGKPLAWQEVDESGEEGQSYERDSSRKSKGKHGKSFEKEPIHFDHEKGHGTGKVSDTLHKKCVGVNKGSAFWVPGLDQWCVQNCAQGYCPATHCIC